MTNFKMEDVKAKSHRKNRIAEPIRCLSSKERKKYMFNLSLKKKCDIKFLNMKKIVKYVPYLMLFIAAVITSCSSDNELNENINTFNTKSSETHFNTQENRDAIIAAIPRIEFDYDATYSYEDYDYDELLSDYSECSECPQSIKSFMLPFLSDIIETKDDDVLSVVSRYRAQIDTYDADFNTKQNLEFIFFSIYHSAEYKLNGTITTKTLSENKVALGIAGGFLTGCATGAYVGATVGTVTVPILGTAVGAVGGCIFAGAWGATTGAAMGGF